MVPEVAVNTQSAARCVREFDVTDLSSGERRRLFVCCFAEGGFVGFDKRRVGDQTYFVFIYNNKKEKGLN
jgi:hypothetical protein